MNRLLDISKRNDNNVHSAHIEKGNKKNHRNAKALLPIENSWRAGIGWFQCVY